MNRCCTFVIIETVTAANVVHTHNMSMYRTHHIDAACSGHWQIGIKYTVLHHQNLLLRPGSLLALLAPELTASSWTNAESTLSLSARTAPEAGFTPEYSTGKIRQVRLQRMHKNEMLQQTHKHTCHRMNIAKLCLRNYNGIRMASICLAATYLQTRPD